MIGPTQFIKNKYYRWYINLINRARMRTYDSSLHENHHLYPESFGGTRAARVPLTFREHFLCHWLLTKFTVGKAKMKMCFALSMMKRRHEGHLRNLSTWQYEVSRKANVGIKRDTSAAVSACRGRVPYNKGKPSPLKGIKRGPSSLRGRKKSPESIAKTTAGLRGKLKSEEHKQKLRESTLRHGKGARRYLVTDPNNTQVEILNLTQFCKDNGLSIHSTKEVVGGRVKTHKGWLCQKVG